MTLKRGGDAESPHAQRLGATNRTDHDAGAASRRPQSFTARASCGVWDVQELPTGIYWPSSANRLQADASYAGPEWIRGAGCSELSQGPEGGLFSTVKSGSSPAQEYGRPATRVNDATRSNCRSNIAETCGQLRPIPDPSPSTSWSTSTTRSPAQQSCD